MFDLFHRMDLLQTNFFPTLTPALSEYCLPRNPNCPWHWLFWVLRSRRLSKGYRHILIGWNLPPTNRRRTGCTNGMILSFRISKGSPTLSQILYLKVAKIKQGLFYVPRCLDLRLGEMPTLTSYLLAEESRCLRTD